MSVRKRKLAIKRKTFGRGRWYLAIKQIQNDFKRVILFGASSSKCKAFSGLNKYYASSTD